MALQPYIFLGIFHYFGHHGRPTSQILNPRLSFNYFNPAILLIKKKIVIGRYTRLGQRILVELNPNILVRDAIRMSTI